MQNGSIDAEHGLGNLRGEITCLYCGTAPGHTDLNCPVMLLDKARECGWHVDFPDEEPDRERAAGQWRIRLYAGRFGCCVADMFKHVGLRGWCKCHVCERGGTGRSPPAHWVRAGAAHECSGDATCEGCGYARDEAGEHAAAGGDRAAPAGGEGGRPEGAGAPAAVREHAADELGPAPRHLPVGGVGEGAGGEGDGGGGAGPVVYFARTRTDLRAGYPRRFEAAPLAEAVGGRLVAALVHLYGLRPQTVKGARGPRAAPEPAVAGGVGGGGEPGPVHGDAPPGGGGERAGAGADDAAGESGASAGAGGGAGAGGVKRKADRFARKYRPMKSRVRFDGVAAYNDALELFSSMGKYGLEADLRAKIRAAHARCVCQTCVDVDMDAHKLEDFVPDREWHRKQWYVEQYVECSDCDMVEAVRRFIAWESNRRGSL